MTATTTLEQREQVQEQLRSVYTPSRPVRDPKLLSGRDALLASSQSQIGTVTGFLLFGGPGVGKTSFALSLFAGKRIGLHTCSATTDMASVFADLIDKLDAGFVEVERTVEDELAATAGVDKVFSVGSKLTMGSKEEKVFKPTLNLNHVLSELEKRQTKFDVLAIDEFHRVKSVDVHDQLLELIKGCADRGMKLSVVVAGQAEQAEGLIRSAELRDYLQRSIIAMKIPPLTKEDLLDILVRRERVFNVKIEPDVGERIVAISGDSVTLVHRLALAASSAWLLRSFSYHVTKGFRWLLGLVGIRSDQAVELDKVGVAVEMEDLRSALRGVIDSFEAGNPEAAQQYHLAQATRDARSVLAAIAAGHERPFPYQAVATRVRLPVQEVRQIVLQDCGPLFTERDSEAFDIALPAGLAYLRAQDELHPQSEILTEDRRGGGSV
jgi:hypothetical protein